MGGIRISLYNCLTNPRQSGWLTKRKPQKKTFLNTLNVILNVSNQKQLSPTVTAHHPQKKKKIMKGKHIVYYVADGGVLVDSIKCINLKRN